MIYVSDHGENLFDYPNIGFGRGYGKLTPQIFHVPVFFWASETYRNSNITEWAALSENFSQQATTENLMNTLATLAGMYWKDFDSTSSLANYNYKPQEQLFIARGKTINYQSYFGLETNE